MERRRFSASKALLASLAVLPFLLVLSLKARALEVPIQPRLAISEKTFALESDPEMSCNGTVNGYVTLPAPAVGRHQLEGVWMKPDGSVQEHSVVTVDFPEPGRQTVKVWLRFNSGGVLSSLTGSDTPSSAFDGTWSLVVKWDEKPLVQDKFKVRC